MATFNSLNDTVTFTKVTSFDQLVQIVIDAKKLFTNPTLILSDTTDHLYDATFNVECDNRNDEDVSITIVLIVEYNNSEVTRINVNINGSQLYKLGQNNSYSLDMTASVSAYSYAAYNIKTEALKLANACHTLEMLKKDITSENIKDCMPTSQNSITTQF